MAKPKTRTETDSLGAVAVPADRYWGAQTQRCLENFPIGEERMPEPLIRALGLQKQAAAEANMALGTLDKRRGRAIVRAAKEVASGALADHFPLPVWQTGSGTQTNMNANEVIANRANELLGGKRGAKSPVHPNDHVNLSQSSNDTIPTVIHVAAVLEIERRLLPALDRLRRALDGKARAFRPIVKLGRTHLQDATPLTLGQEFSGYAAQIADAAKGIRASLPALRRVAQGGTAVGTGLNAPQGFDRAFADALSRIAGTRFTPAPNKFAGLAAHDAVLAASGALNVLAAAMLKIANDIRLLGSGPRAGLGELILPANEPGSSIMPGKVNPTQAEALTQIAVQIIGNHAAVTAACAGGFLELNLYKPVIAYNALQSIRLAADGADSFTRRCIAGIRPNRARIDALMRESLMLVTALTPHIGYDAAARIAKKAHEDGSTLKQAAAALGLVSEADFDRWVRPADMTRPGR